MNTSYEIHLGIFAKFRIMVKRIDTNVSDLKRIKYICIRINSLMIVSPFS